jgi:hypothetical protein
MNGTDHPLLVKLAFEAAGKKFHHLAANLASAQSTCMYPDTYAVPLFENQSGPWRKYFTPGKHKSNPNIQQLPLRKCLPPFRFYVSNIIKLLKNKDYQEAAKFTGVFSHLLGDFSQPAHWYETAAFALMPPPPKLCNCTIHFLIEGLSSNLKAINYEPKLLGTTQSELIFNLENRFAELNKKSIAAIVPMLQALYRGNEAGARKIYNPVMKTAAEILVDFCFSVHAIAFKTKEFLDQNKTECDLRKALPYAYDVEKLFGSLPLIDTVTPPFAKGSSSAFKLRTGKKSITEIKGICAVPYAMPSEKRPLWSWLEYHLPSGTFSSFQSKIGMCADLKPQASARFEVESDGKTLFKSPMLSAKDPAMDINIDISGIKKLKLLVYTDGSTDKLAYPIWGNPLLIKN